MRKKRKLTGFDNVFFFFFRLKMFSKKVSKFLIAAITVATLSSEALSAHCNQLQAQVKSSSMLRFLQKSLMPHNRYELKVILH